MRGLIYPVPDPAFPFLGVHATRGIDGHVHAGPNAVLALAREGYGWGTVNPRELLATLAYPGMLRVAQEALALRVRRDAPLAVEGGDGPADPADAARRHGRRPVARRARACARRPSSPDGTLVDDFLFAEQGRGAGAVLHVLNAPSPAATAALPIGREIVERLTGDRLGPL